MSVCFNLDQSEILSSGNGLIRYSVLKNDTLSTCSLSHIMLITNLLAIALTDFNWVDRNLQKFMGRPVRSA